MRGGVPCGSFEESGLQGVRAHPLDLQHVVGALRCVSAARLASVSSEVDPCARRWA